MTATSPRSPVDDLALWTIYDDQETFFRTAEEGSRWLRRQILRWLGNAVLCVLILCAVCTAAWMWWPNSADTDPQLRDVPAAGSAGTTIVYVQTPDDRWSLPGVDAAG